MNRMTFAPRVRSVVDPIHGLIRLTEDEMRVVDHRLFRRLRDIKQNGLLYLVFPAATHTRFEHSLGVVYVVHGMLNSLTLNSSVGLSKGNVVALEDSRGGLATTFPKPDTPEHDFVYTVARFAALIHDMGHGPLSHTFDSFAPRREHLSTILDHESLRSLSRLREDLEESGKKPDKPADVANDRIPHEVMSCLFFAHIASELQLHPDIAPAVVAAVLGGTAYQQLQNPVGRQWGQLIHDLIASAPADADRMDYLERDSRSIGVTYGLFDRNRVLKSLLVYRDSSSGAFRLGIKRSGLQAVENLVQARYEMFVQVYYHKTNRAVSRMLESIADAAEAMELFPPDHSFEQWIQTYLDLSDEQFIRRLQSHRGGGAERLSQIADDLLGRRLWRRVLEATSKSQAESVLTALQQEFADEAAFLRLDSTKPNPLKDLQEGARLLARGEGGKYRVLDSKMWYEESDILKGLVDAQQKASSRIYLDASGVARAGEIRQRALELAAKSGRTDRAEA